MKCNYHLNNVYFSDPVDYGALQLLQIGRLHCKNVTVVDTHIHTELFEITVVTDGAGTVTTNGVPTKVKNRDIYLSMPRDIHKIESDSDNPLKYDFFAFKIKNNGFKAALYRIADDYRSPNNRIIQDERIRRLTANAIAELASPDIYSKELLASAFRQILIYLIRDFRKMPDGNHPDNATGAETLCYRFMNYIDTHIYTMKNLSELCEATGYSYGYISALFRKTTSEKLSDYYNKKKSDVACLLLKENKLTVTEISETLGYSSLYAFSKAFKKQLGISPRIYKKQLIYEENNRLS